MGAAIDQSVDCPVRVAIHDDWGVADIGGAEIARVGDLVSTPERKCTGGPE